MIFYHLYLFAEGDILIRQDFYAENDAIACGIAAIVADACSDQCDAFELWDGTRIVLSDVPLRAAEVTEGVEKVVRRTIARIERAEDSLESLRETLETSAAALEESAMNANERLRRSERLSTRLADIRNKRRQ